MARENKNKQNAHYLTNYVTKLRRLNDVEPETPKDISIDEIIADPTAFALAFVEREFAKNIPSFIEAFRLGQDLAKNNLAAK